MPVATPLPARNEGSEREHSMFGGDILQTVVPRLARYARAPIGRLHRRRPHRYLQHRRPGGRMPSDQWWSGDDRWYERDTPPRRHNALRPLIDGQETFATMLKAIA